MAAIGPTRTTCKCTWNTWQVAPCPRRTSGTPWSGWMPRSAKICLAQVLSNFGPLEESLMARYTSYSETLRFYVILPCPACPCDVHTDRAGAASAVRQQLLSGKDPQRSQRPKHNMTSVNAILLIPGITWGWWRVMKAMKGIWQVYRYIKFNFGRPRAFHCWPVLQPSYA